MSKFTPNSFQVPNAFVDVCLDQISDAATKIYLVINRKTRGWNKEMDSISLTQFEKITGKSRPTIVKCLKELVNIGLVVEENSTVHGKTYKMGDESSIEKKPKSVASKNILLPNFFYPVSKNSLLVKNFNPTSKNFLPLLVKIFNTQKTLSKDTNQNKKKEVFLEKLKKEILSADNQIDFDEFVKASWFERELQAFENFNAEKQMTDAVKFYHLADWLLNAKTKYEKRKAIASGEKNITARKTEKLSEKQISAFALKLSNHSEFASAHAPAGWSTERFTAWVASKLAEQKYLGQWAVYLKQVGFAGEIAC